MKRITVISYNLACVISMIVGIMHFTAPYLFEWYSYIPEAPLGIIQSINYVNFCFSLLLAGLSLLLLLVQKKTLEGSKELRLFYLFFVLVWLLRIVIQVYWSWPTFLQVWLVTAFSIEFIFSIVPVFYWLGKNRAS